MSKKITLGMLLGLFVLVGGCALLSSPEKIDDTQKQANSLSGTIEYTLSVIKAFDCTGITKVMSNEEVLFSPYGHVQLEQHVSLDKQAFLDACNSQETFLRGYQDGSGFPIEKTLQAYRDRYVYDLDYANEAELLINENTQRGTTLYNVFDIYPNAEIIEWYVNMQKPKYEGMDRRSLVIVLEKESGEWKLKAIVHREWTI